MCHTLSKPTAGFLKTIRFISSDATDSIASARTPNRILLKPSFWRGGWSDRRQEGIIAHEMTHLFGNTDDKVGCIQEGGEHEPLHDPPTWSKIEKPLRIQLITNADTYEMFIEDYLYGELA